MKRFLYLFQVAQDLPPALEQACSPDGDVMFLSYRARSTDPRAVFYPSSSWTQGRNRLLKAAQGTPYLYYIFGDGDVQLEFTRAGARAAPRRQSPWRAFEQFLLTHEPAVGTPAYFWHLSGRADESRPVETLRFFDPVLNAFHREAVWTLLPYCDLMDEACADYSGRIVSSLAADLYPGHVLQSNHVRVLNPESLRGYTERLLSKPEDLYLDSVTDPATKASYRRQHEWGAWPHPGTGAPARKPANYHLSHAALAARYDLDHVLWRRKQELIALPETSDFFSDALDSPRAARWAAHNPGTVGAPPDRFGRLLRATRSWRVRLGLVRTAPAVVTIRRLRDRVRRLPATMGRLQQRYRPPTVRGRWRAWSRGAVQHFEFPAVDHLGVLDLLGNLFDRLATPRILLACVGTGQDDLLSRLRSGRFTTRLVLAVSIEPAQSGGFSAFTGHVLGTIGERGLTLPMVLTQYGFDNHPVHYLHLTTEQAGTVLDSLAAAGVPCLCLTVPEPGAGVRATIESHGFRLLAVVASAGDRPAEFTFIHGALLHTLLP